MHDISAFSAFLSISRLPGLPPTVSYGAQTPNTAVCHLIDEWTQAHVGSLGCKLAGHIQKVWRVVVGMQTVRIGHL